MMMFYTSKIEFWTLWIWKKNWAINKFCYDVIAHRIFFLTIFFAQKRIIFPGNFTFRKNAKDFTISSSQSKTSSHLIQRYFVCLFCFVCFIRSIKFVTFQRFNWIALMLSSSSSSSWCLFVCVCCWNYSIKLNWPID